MTSPSKVSLEDFQKLLIEDLPIADLLGFQTVSLTREIAILKAPGGANSLRPGGTISGPVMMGLADATFYGIVLANIGLVKLAVTTNLSINFLRKPAPGNLFCKASILKLGKRLAVCEAVIYSEQTGSETPVAHVTGTYSIPDKEL